MSVSNSTPMDFYRRFDWLPVELADAKVGDIHANTGGSITRVVHGPKKIKDYWKEVLADEVLIRCGSDFSLKAKKTSVIIVGRVAGGAEQ